MKLTTFSLFLLLAFVVTTSNARAKTPPNIIFIMADDMGYGELGCYGQTKIKTPNIDALAKEGMKFTQCYAGSSVCQPSRSVLMTGQHTGHTAVRNNDTSQLLYDEDVTVAEVLKKAGYTCGAFGKWGVGYEGTPGRPLNQGFDTFSGQLLQVHAHFYYPYWIWKDEQKLELKGNLNGKREDYVQDVLQEHAVSFIKKNHKKPFFAYLPFIIPHVELVVPEESEIPYRGKFPKVSIQDPRPKYIGSEDGYTTLAGMISRFDKQVGEITQLLKDLGIEDNTLIIFTSDNGGQSGGKNKGWTKMTDFFDGNGILRGYKGTFYEGGIRVPFIAKWKGKIKAGTTSDHICGFQDILPTFAEAAGVAFNIPESVDGISILPTLLGTNAQANHNGMYWEMSRSSKMTSRAARMGDWKAVQTRMNRSIELYNLKSDPSESTNVAKQNPEIVAKMEKFLAESHKPMRKYTPFKRNKPTVHDFVQFSK